MKEIELLVKVNESKESALHKLKDLKFIGKKSLLDVYLFEKKTDRFMHRTMQDKGFPSECLRLRKSSDTVFLTYKKDHFDKTGKWLYSDEEETEVSDFDNMLLILKNLGYAEIARLENERMVYTTDKYEIVLEDVKNLGLFMEVEILTEENVDIPKIKDEMTRFLKELGLNVSDELNQGKLELLMKKQKL